MIAVIDSWSESHKRMATLPPQSTEATPPDARFAPGSGASAGGDSAPAQGAPAFSPLYQQIKGLMLQILHACEWRPGELITSEIELAARSKVSQGTMSKGIDELYDDNLVIRR